jgi:hypothetical protein
MALSLPSRRQMRIKLVATLLAVGMASACGMHPDPSQTPMWVGTVSHKLQLMKAERGSTYMKELVESVTPARDGVAASTDTWKLDDGTVVREPYLYGPTREALEHAIGDRHPPPDREVVYEQLSATGWRTYVVEVPAVLDGTAVEKAELTTDPSTQREVVRLDFTPEAASKLGDITAAMVGDKLAVVSDGKVVSAPIITTAIRGGSAEISFATDGDARAFLGI